jgi:hypothetical protein
LATKKRSDGETGEKKPARSKASPSGARRRPADEGGGDAGAGAEPKVAPAVVKAAVKAAAKKAARPRLRASHASLPENEGQTSRKLPRPKRTINFQWVPEIAGTNAYLTAHPEKKRAIIGTLNFDMEGIRVAASRSYWILQRTPDTFPSYINDVAQSMMEYVSEISRERVRFRRSILGYAPTQPVESPRGSKDAFYIKIDKHYGSSDHVTYMQHGIPAVMFITWPDMWYHSSEDTPDKQDPTQYKRAAAVGLGSLAVISSLVALNTWKPSPSLAMQRSTIWPRSRASI